MDFNQVEHTLTTYDVRNYIESLGFTAIPDQQKPQNYVRYRIPYQINDKLSPIFISFGAKGSIDLIVVW